MEDQLQTEKTALAGQYVLLEGGRKVKILDKVLKGASGTKEHGMFHWKQISAYGYSYEVYLVEYDVEVQDRLDDEEFDEDGNTRKFEDRVIYRTEQRIMEIDPKEIKSIVH